MDERKACCWETKYRLEEQVKEHEYERKCKTGSPNKNSLIKKINNWSIEFEYSQENVHKSIFKSNDGAAPAIGTAKKFEVS